ncbi:hypothetical protein ASPCADRAFT_207390 [Aspergillus carbonarius ITEM 5010]|uniref:Uncharacterized protein n=1 Tax=Aspergillus carbonarius (strain ITEM 5010) TaxID=602072 RepID=A0A1R3RNH4_ASPC5|nr:hypothetical protein ASPCADRAFT_207390 [Aspergillus carbonarius ITEM 5010]
MHDTGNAAPRSAPLGKTQSRSRGISFQLPKSQKGTTVSGDFHPAVTPQLICQVMPMFTDDCIPLESSIMAMLFDHFDEVLPATTRVATDHRQSWRLSILCSDNIPSMEECTPHRL